MLLARHPLLKLFAADQNMIITFTNCRDVCYCLNLGYEIYFEGYKSVVDLFWISRVGWGPP